MSTARLSNSTQLVVNVTDITLTNKIRNAIKMIQGVGKITLVKPAQKDACPLDSALQAAHSEPLYTANDIDELMDGLKA